MLIRNHTLQIKLKKIAATLSKQGLKRFLHFNFFRSQDIIQKYTKLNCIEREIFYKKHFEEFEQGGNDVNGQAAAIFSFLINFSEKNIPIFSKDLKLATRPDKEIDFNSPQVNLAHFNHKVISLAHLLRKNKVIFSAGDYFQCLRALTTIEDAVIFDPPYPCQAHNIYFNLQGASALKTRLGKTFQELGQKKVDFIVMYGAGLIPLGAQWNDIGLQRLLRLSYHPLYGEFLEHIYVSSGISLTAANLPEKVVFYDHIFKPNREVSSEEYAEALAHLQSKPNRTALTLKTCGA